MRILLENIPSPGAGKSFFVNRFRDEAKSQGHEIVHDPVLAHDCSLHAIRMWCKSRRPRFLRLDGVYFNTAQNWISKNGSIETAVAEADGIICQSQWGFEMSKRYVGVNPEKATVILNGAPVLPYNPDKGNYFMAVSKWRPHKRMNDIIESFLMADTDDKLLVCGSAMPEIKHQRIQYCGLVPQERLAELYVRAKGLIHLCWFDCCPNSVVEATCSGCPTITNNVGGTREIVEPAGGIVLELDKPYNYETVDLYNPPEIDRRMVADAVEKLSAEPIKPRTEHVDIKSVSKAYINFMIS